MMARMLQGDMSVPDMIVLAAGLITINAPAVDSMPQDCLQDLTRLLHFVDDLELGANDFEWNEVFDFPKCDHNHDNYAAAHRIKWALVEDAHVKRWQDCVKFGKWATANESRLARLYHSPSCTIGPGPKPI